MNDSVCCSEKAVRHDEGSMDSNFHVFMHVWDAGRLRQEQQLIDTIIIIIQTTTIGFLGILQDPWLKWKVLKLLKRELNNNAPHCSMKDSDVAHRPYWDAQSPYRDGQRLIKMNPSSLTNMWGSLPLKVNWKSFTNSKGFDPDFYWIILAASHTFLYSRKYDY